MSLIKFDYDKWLTTDIDSFKKRVLQDSLGVLDADGIHHEFVSGMHGQKLDFDKIVTGSDFYIQWVSLYARAIMQIYGNKLPDAIVGIANGANRLATSIAPLLREGIIVLQTEKIDAKTVRLTADSVERLRQANVTSVLIVEDVGTTGSTTVSAVQDLADKGIANVEALNGWIRTPSLTRLDDIRLGYYSLVHAVLPVFMPEECMTLQDGFCSQGFEFVAHVK